MTNLKENPLQLQSTKELKSVMQQYFQELEEASSSKHRKIAWCSSIGPCELLIAMGFDVYYPENHAALLGATRKSTEMIPLAVAAGYSPEICSYLTSDVGAFLKGVTPLAEAYGMKSVPKADVLFFNNNQCREVQDWFMFYARQWQVPIVGVNSPRVLDEVKQSLIDTFISKFSPRQSPRSQLVLLTFHHICQIALQVVGGGCLLAMLGRLLTAG